VAAQLVAPQEGLSSVNEYPINLFMSSRTHYYPSRKHRAREYIIKVSDYFWPQVGGILILLHASDSLNAPNTAYRQYARTN
jgi:hypothetical protein